MHPRPLLDWIAFNLLPLGSILRGRALARFGDPGEIAYRVPPQAFRELGRVRAEVPRKVSELRRSLRRRAERELQRCEKYGIRIITCEDADYPAAFETLHDPPVLIYLRGELPGGVLRVAIVGSRRTTAYGRRVATGLASQLAVRGIEIVSGGARGIDTCAHRAALEQEGRTVAVLGSGLLQPYPAENEALFRAIGNSGATLSEFPLDAPPASEHFPMRNRLISGLAAAVVVVEAALKSGSFITARHALDQGREVMAVPGPISSPRSIGCHELIQQGAKLVKDVNDILDELPPMYLSGLREAATGHNAPDLEGLSPDEDALIRILDAAEPTHLDTVADEAPFGIARVQAALVGLEVRGAVEQLAGGYYLLRPLESC